MLVRYMLDTDICIDFQRGRSAGIARRMRDLGEGDAIISVITYGELRLGAERSDRREIALRALDAIIALAHVKPISEEVGAEYAVIRADLQRRGQLIGSNDLWIAAHARSAGLTLVTNNEREFRRVPGLNVENWAVAP